MKREEKKQTQQITARKYEMMFGSGALPFKKALKETNLIKFIVWFLYFHSYGWFLLLLLNGMRYALIISPCIETVFPFCIIFLSLVLSIYCGARELRTASNRHCFSSISGFMISFWIHTLTECHFKHLFYLHCLCAFIASLLAACYYNAADIPLLFYTI